MFIPPVVSVSNLHQKMKKPQLNRQEVCHLPLESIKPISNALKCNVSIAPAAISASHQIDVRDRGE